MKNGCLNYFFKYKEKNYREIPYLGLYNAHWCIMLGLENLQKKLYNAHGLLKKSLSEM